MAITFVAATNTSYASRTNVTGSAPSGATTGDILIANVITATSSEAVDPTPVDADWTLIGTAIDVTDTGFNLEHRTYIATYANISSYVFNHSSSASQLVISAWRGVDATTPQDITSTQNSGASGTTTWTGGTTATAGAMMVLVGTDWGDTANNLSPPTSFTEFVDVAPLVYGAYQIQASAGATGNKTHTNNNGGSGHPFTARAVFLRPASGSTYTLDADAGSYAITGTAAGTQYGRLVDAAAGSYAITGTAAGTQYGRQVAALAGSYAVSGTDVTFPKTWILDAAAGSYALTGTAAGLQFGHVLDAAAGSYAISGQTAALTVGYQVAAAAGSYAITGTAATFPRTYLLDAGAGSYTISGTDATLTKATFGAYVLDADAGSYSLTGTDAGLLASHADLIAAAGSYALTGQDASLSYALVLEAEGGEYLLTGSPATLTYDGAGAPAAGRSGVSRLALNAKPPKPPKWMLPTEGPRELPEVVLPEVPVTLEIETAEKPVEEPGFDPTIINEDIMRVAAMLAGFAVD